MKRNGSTLCALVDFTILKCALLTKKQNAERGVAETDSWRSENCAHRYLSFAENTRQIQVDASPNYINDRQFVTCQRLAAYLPRTSRFVAIIRKPVERLWSLEKMIRRRLLNM